MNKKIFTIGISVLCTGILATAVFATSNFNVSSSNIISDTSEISSVLSNSNVVRSIYQYEESRNNENSEAELSSIDEVQTYNLQSASTLATNSIDNSSIIPVYSITIDNSSQSLFSDSTVENDMWIASLATDEGISYAYLKKGGDVEPLVDKVNSLNISDEYKEMLIKRANEREGKWYVAYIETQRSAQEAQSFVNMDNINNIINESNISNVTDIKYVYITNTNKLAVYVQTITSEYIIPYKLDNKDVNNGELCSLSSFKDSVLD